jgi:hypothetical protein
MITHPEDERLFRTRELAEHLAATGHAEEGFRRLQQGLDQARRYLSVRDVSTAKAVAAWRAAMHDYSIRHQVIAAA